MRKRGEVRVSAEDVTGSRLASAISEEFPDLGIPPCIFRFLVPVFTASHMEFEGAKRIRFVPYV